MGANNSSSGSSKSKNPAIAGAKAQYEGAKKQLAAEREKLARLRACNNSKSTIDYQKAAIERAKDHVAKTKAYYDHCRGK